MIGLKKDLKHEETEKYVTESKPQRFPMRH
jgi:hypothetical protein